MKYTIVETTYYVGFKNKIKDIRMAKINSPKMLSGENTLPYNPPPTKYARAPGTSSSVQVI